MKKKNAFMGLSFFVGFFMCTACLSFKSQEIKIELKGNPSTGYTWDYSLSNENSVSISKEVKYTGKDGIVGAPSIYYFKIKSHSPGNSTLTLEYKRPWEENKVLEKKKFNITVNSKGKIIMEEIKAKQEQKISFKSVSMEEGLNLMKKSQDFILLDVRRLDEYKEGHIPNAILLTNELITKEKAESLLLDKNQEIFVYCRSGRRSKEASLKLCNFGYTNIIEIGGIINYKGNIEY